MVAEIAGSEGPREDWRDLIESLLHSMMQADSLASLKQATLETLGYVCEEISHQERKQNEVNAILTAIMNLAQYPAEIRLAAAEMPHNALGFALDLATSQEVEIRQAGYECLVAIASMYYEVLEPYMQTLFELTSKSVKEDEETVALQTIGF